jgi:hypothetical protein
MSKVTLKQNNIYNKWNKIMSCSLKSESELSVTSFEASLLPLQLGPHRRKEYLDCTPLHRPINNDTHPIHIAYIARAMLSSPGHTLALQRLVGPSSLEEDLPRRVSCGSCSRRSSGWSRPPWQGTRRWSITCRLTSRGDGGQRW